MSNNSYTNFAYNLYFWFTLVCNTNKNSKYDRFQIHEYVLHK